MHADRAAGHTFPPFAGMTSGQQPGEVAITTQGSTSWSSSRQTSGSRATSCCCTLTGQQGSTSRTVRSTLGWSTRQSSLRGTSAAAALPPQLALMQCHVGESHRIRSEKGGSCSLLHGNDGGTSLPCAATHQRN